MTISEEIKALVSTLEMQLNGFAKAAYEKDKRIAELERQLAEASAPAVERQPVKPWEERMEEYFAQGSVRMRTPAYFMADEIIDWRKITLAAPQAADTDKVREALNGLHNGIMNLPHQMPITKYAVGAEAFIAYKEGHRDARHAAAELVGSMAAQAPVREVPGYRLVPIEPTQEMLDEIVGYCVEEKLLKNRYAAMLAAAPLPAAPVQQEGDGNG